MEISIEETYLTETTKLFRYYKLLAEKAMSQLEKEQIFYSADSDKINSIAVIISHLHGNMISRFTDFLTTDGEKPWRNRDAEFLHPGQDFENIMKQWEAGWECLFNALKTLLPHQLGDIIYIRNEGHTILEAIQRQLAHYSMHVGQIVFYAKQLKKGEWNSLSISPGKSGDYNKEKFDIERQVKNFTENEIKRLEN